MTTALNFGLRRAAARLTPDPAPDGELLSRFLASRDETAFALLVRRHAGMVFGTCRRVLGNASDADDAFQAAFVVLVRKAHSLTDRACVGNFLYGVAFHTALKARSMATKRRAKEAKATRSESADSGELTRVLDEELAKLPDKYREPVVLCELDGVSRKDAAARLSIPEGTVSSRLATAHRMLAKRLAARGFAAVAVAAVLGNQAFAVPDGLAEAAVRAAADGPPAGVTQLATEVSKMLLWNKLKAGVVLTGVLLACGIGFGLVAKGFAADDKPAVKAPVPAKKADDAKLLQGKWVPKGTTFDPPLPVPPGAKQEHAHHALTFTDGDLTWETFIPSDPKTRSTQTKPFKLDQTTTPKELTSGDMECVYELDGDTLKVAMYFLTPGRPKGFNSKDSPPGKGHIILIELTREKKPEEDKSYSLKDGEVLKLIPAPFPKEREEVVRLQKDFKHLGISDQVLLTVTIENGKPVAVGGGMSRGVDFKPGGTGIPLSVLFTALLKYDLTSLSDPDWLLQSTRVDCDVLLKKGATPAEWVPALQKELKAKYGVELVTEFREAETEVIVIRGKHTFKPVQGEYDLVRPTDRASLVELFTTEKRQYPFGGGIGGIGGTSRSLPCVLAQFLGRPVVDESDLATNEVALGVRCSVIQHSTRKGALMEGTPEAVFADLEKQTGLTFKLEKRKVRALVVQKAKADKAEADKSYSLKDDEILKLIAAPFPEARESVFLQVNRRRSLAGGPKGYRMVIPADGADLRQCFLSTSAENGWPLRQAFTAILNIDPMDCIADDKTLAAMFDADALVRPDTPAEKLLPVLRAELKAKCGIDVTLEFKEMEREVVVASGTYLKRAGPNQIEPQHEYILDTDEPKGKPNWGAHVFNAGFLPAIGTYVRRPVIDETNLKQLPNISFSLNEYHHTKPDDPAFNAPDPETVLKRLADQTGLTFKLEKRKVRALVVAKAKLDADKPYTLKDGEVLKLIPAPFPKERDEVFGRIPANKRSGSPTDNSLLAVVVGDGAAEVSEFAARRHKDGDPVKPPQLLHYVRYLLKIDTTNVSDPNWLLESTVLDADVVLRTGAKPDELLTALSRELKAKCGIDLTLSVGEVETDVVVLSGTHTLKRNHAFPSRPYNDAAHVNLMDKPLLASRTASTAQLPAELATFVGRPVIDESDLKTNDVAVWIGRPDYDTRPQATDRDPAKVLKSFADQTGLTFKLEKRKVRALVVQKVNSDRKNEGDQKDIDAIEGTWAATEWKQQGVAQADGMKKLLTEGGFQITFAAGTMTYEFDRSSLKYTLEPLRDPKQVQLRTPGGGIALGIYELKGDELKLCIGRTEPQNGKTPPVAPTGFDADSLPPGATLFVMKRVTKKSDDPKAKPPEKKDEPAWKAEFRKAYGLKDGQLVRRVASPYPECRDVFFKDMFRNQPPAFPYDDWFSVFGWNGDWIDPKPGQFTMPIRPDVGVSLDRLLDMVLKISSTRMEADLTTRNQKVMGDFVVRAGADPEKAAAELEAILRTELDLPVRFKFRDSEEEVYVLTGKYTAKPLDGKKADEVEVYSLYRDDGKTGGGGSGTFQEMIAAVERHVSKTVVLGKLAGTPKSVTWHFSTRGKATAKEHEEDRHAPTILENIAKQTGLELTTEKRKVRVLMVDHEEVKKGEPKKPE